MQDMASRPFASALVYIPHTQQTDHQRRDHQQRHEHQQRIVRLIKSASQRELQPSDMTADSTSLRLSPVAVEPTRSGVAVIATFVFELPCSTVAPVRACLGSCLLTPRILHASTSVHYVSVKPTAAVAQTRSSVT